MNADKTNTKGPAVPADPGVRDKSAWLESGAGDLDRETIYDCPKPGHSVVVQGLGASYSNQAQSEALEMRTIGRNQIATINTDKMEQIQFLHGVVDPTFSPAEVEQIARTWGRAWRKVVDKIDELSGVDKKSIKEAEARFPASDGDTSREDVAGAGAGGSGAE